jgi:nucleoside-diphosphate kinase
MVWQGPDVVKQGRAMIGATNPQASAPGTIRGDYCLMTGRNIIHGSDSTGTAQIEIGLWFKNEELLSWDQQIAPWIIEK